MHALYLRIADEPLIPLLVFATARWDTMSPTTTRRQEQEQKGGEIAAPLVAKRRRGRRGKKKAGVGPDTEPEDDILLDER